MMESELDDTVRVLLVEEALKEVARTDFTGVCGDLVRLILERVGRPYPDDQSLRDIGVAVDLNEAEPGDILFGYPNKDDFVLNEPRTTGIIIKAARYNKEGMFLSSWGGAKRGYVKSIQVREYHIWHQQFSESSFWQENYKVRRVR